MVTRETRERMHAVRDASGRQVVDEIAEVLRVLENVTDPEPAVAAGWPPTRTTCWTACGPRDSLPTTSGCARRSGRVVPEDGTGRRLDQAGARHRGRHRAGGRPRRARRQPARLEPEQRPPGRPEHAPDLGRAGARRVRCREAGPDPRPGAPRRVRTRPRTTPHRPTHQGRRAGSARGCRDVRPSEAEEEEAARLRFDHAAGRIMAARLVTASPRTPPRTPPPR